MVEALWFAVASHDGLGVDDAAKNFCALNWIFDAMSFRKCIKLIRLVNIE